MTQQQRSSYFQRRHRRPIWNIVLVTASLLVVLYLFILQIQTANQVTKVSIIQEEQEQQQQHYYDSQQIQLQKTQKDEESSKSNSNSNHHHYHYRTLLEEEKVSSSSLSSPWKENLLKTSQQQEQQQQLQQQSTLQQQQQTLQQQQQTLQPKFNISNPIWPTYEQILEYSSKSSSFLSYFQNNISVNNNPFDNNNDNNNININKNDTFDCYITFHNPQLQLCHINPYNTNGNFGDELGPPIVQRILQLLYPQCSTARLPIFDLVQLLKYPTKFANRTFPCLLTVGSLWPMIRNGDSFWGTGAARDGEIKHRCRKYQHSNLTIFSTRGPKSYQKIIEFCGQERIVNPLSSIVPAGDAGFLVPYLFPELMIMKQEERYEHEQALYNALEDDNPTTTIATSSRITMSQIQNTTTTTTTTITTTKKPYCVIPHAKEKNHPKIQKVPSNYIVSVEQSWTSMIVQMQQSCSQILSSSLHGIILAEALRIPNQHLVLTKQPGLFKFQDFYESFRSTQEIVLPGGEEVKEEPILTDIPKEFLSLSSTTLTKNNNNTSSSFPIILPLPLSKEHCDLYARKIVSSFPIHLFRVVMK